MSTKTDAMEVDIGLKRLNEERSAGVTFDRFLRCCGSRRWAREMTRRTPFVSRDGLRRAAREIWRTICDRSDQMEAFAAHPRIGERKVSGEKKKSERSWEGEEQAGTAEASSSVLDALTRANLEYEKRHGFVFLVCATGKSATEMLDTLKTRMGHSTAQETEIAAGEQEKITTLRLAKLLDELGGESKL